MSKCDISKMTDEEAPGPLSPTEMLNKQQLTDRRSDRTVRGISAGPDPPPRQHSATWTGGRHSAPRPSLRTEERNGTCSQHSGLSEGLVLIWPDSELG